MKRVIRADAEIAQAPRASSRGRRWSIPLGRIAGIEIRVHLTFFVLVWLVVAAASAPDGGTVGGNLVWLTLVFAGVLAHELAHSLVARARGIGVTEIELLPIGGVSKMASLPEDPRTELEIAVVGPVTSIVLGLGFGFAAAAAGEALWPPDLAGGPLLSRLLWFNLLVGLFNLLPAFPLDGGRVLRATLERGHGLADATVIAARAGRWTAGAMVALGVLFNVWLVVIGVFVYLGATSEEAGVLVHTRIGRLRAVDVMVAGPVVVTATTPGSVLEELRHRTTQRQFPVVAEDGYVGMIDAGSAAAAPTGSTAGDVADRTVPVLGPEDLVEEAGVLADGRPSFAVVDHGAVVGIVRAADVAELAAEALRTRRRTR